MKGQIHAVQSKLMYVIGTRPEVIRSARIIDHLDVLLGRSNVVLLNSGQHYDFEMMEQFFAQLNVRLPNITLDTHYPNDSMSVAGMMKQIASEINNGQYACVVVYGDTNSSLAAALAAAKERVPVAHIEAGCRSYDLRMQEELNRRIIDHISAVCFAVSETCRLHLENEKVPGRIKVVGDPQFDVYSEVALKVSSSSVVRSVHAGLVGLVTLHRAENVDDAYSLGKILLALSTIAETDEIEWIFPVHPRTRRSLTNRELPGMRLVDPLSYEELLRVLKSARVCVTDSGGLQKEAFWMQVPCVTVRPSTEWPETLAGGRNQLVDDPDRLLLVLRETLTKTIPTDSSNPYGPLGASKRTARYIADWLNEFD